MTHPSNGTYNGCPCCGDSMNVDLVTCWSCYHLSNRLTPGTYTTYDVVETGDTWTITREDIDKWSDQRSDRIPSAYIRA